MMKRLLTLILGIASPLVAQTATLPREYRAPWDDEGFVQALPWIMAEAPPGDPRPVLQILPLNKRGFLHRGRRAAASLDVEPIQLEEAARIYSPSQSFIALRTDQQALLILHPQTSVSAVPLVDRWQYTFTGDRGLVRVSSHQRSVPMAIKPADPQSPWQGHRLALDPGSDIYLKYDRMRIQVYVLRGHLSYRIDPSVPLLSNREPGLLFDWEQKQIERKPGHPYAIELYAGQELTLDPGVNYQIGLPEAETWQAPILRTSPELADGADTNPLKEALKNLRLDWLALWQDEADLPRLLREGRFEEAYAKAGDHEFIKTLCLYRLQQETAAEKKRQARTESSPDATLLQEESIRASLRRSDHDEVEPPKDLVHAKILPESIYLLASSEQQEGRWRSALDLWERWPAVPPDADLQLSYKEWQRHLDQKKPISWQGSAELGWTDNALHQTSGTAAPPEVGHRSSWFFHTEHQFRYQVEHSDDYSLSIDPRIEAKIFQHSGLADLQRIESGLALPLQLRLPWEQQTLRIKPYFYRLLLGSAMGLDRFGYELSWSTTLGSWHPEFSWGQDQNLDLAPTLDHRLDALSGEPTGAMDRSVRRHTLAVREGMFRAEWQSWDYRSVAAETDDRQRFTLSGEYSRDFPYDLRAVGRGSIYQDQVSAIQLHLQLSWFGWVRLHPYLAADRDMRQGGEKAKTFTEMQWIMGIEDRW